MSLVPIAPFLDSVRNDKGLRAPLQFVPLTFFSFLAAQFRLDEHVDIAVHDFLHIAGFRTGAVIFHHLIGLKNVGANLISPRDLTFFAVLSFHLSAFLVLSW